jgi:peptidoglycan/LPS O-acetylase OafA/YrhL
MKIDHRNNFDLIRLYAACNVVLSHSLYHLKLPGMWLWKVFVWAPGVPIFFIVSGFLVTDSFLRSSSPGRYVLNRALRIYPGLAANIIGLEIAMLAVSQVNVISWSGYAKFIATYIATGNTWVSGSVLYPASRAVTHGFFPAYPSGVLWTIPVELSFYIVLLLLLTMYNGNRIVGLLALAGAAVTSITIASHFSQVGPWIQQFFLPYLWIFCIGVAARLSWSYIHRLFEGTFLLWLIFYCVALHFLRPNYDLRNGNQDTILAAIILGGVVLSAAFTWRNVAERVLRKQDISYGIYLWHMLVVYTLMGMGYMQSGFLWLPVVGGTALLAGLSWFLIEKPALSLKHFRWKGRVSSRAGPANASSPSTGEYMPSSTMPAE